MPILVTGAGGMVGSHMMEHFIERRIPVIGSYFHPTTDIRELPPSAVMIECDIRDAERVSQIIDENRPERIFHLAAQSYPTVSWERPRETIDININGTVAIFEAIKRIRKRNAYDPMVVVACSSAEYGQSIALAKEGGANGIDETTPLLPLHPYGVSKVGQDLISFQYFMNDHIRCIRARIFNSTGTRKVNDVTSDFVHRAVEAEKTGSYRLKVGNLETHRAIMDVRDLISALVLLSERGTAGEAYNISSESVVCGAQIVEAIERKIGHRLELEADSALFRPTDERVIFGDASKLKRDTGWKQEIPFEKTVSDMVDYWRKKLITAGM